MSKKILNDALRANLDLTNGTTELCDDDGKPVAYVLSAEEYNRMLYDLAWAEASTPEAKAEAEAAMEEVRQGRYVTTEQLFEELRQLGYMPRKGQ
jgi:hypothetical protein